MLEYVFWNAPGVSPGRPSFLIVIQVFFLNDVSILIDQNCVYTGLVVWICNICALSYAIESCYSY